MASDKILVVTKDNFESSVLKAEKPVVVDFWAEWCGPCRAVAPIMEQLAEEFSGKAVIGKLNVDEQGEIAQKFRIMSIPTVMVFKNGEMVEKVIGARSKNDFAALIEKHI